MTEPRTVKEAFSAWINEASREDLQRVLREYAEELDSLNEGFIAQIREIQRLRRVLEAVGAGKEAFPSP